MSVALAVTWVPLIALIVVLTYLFNTSLCGQRNTRLPPGPRPLPIIGNALDVPRNDLGAEWAAISEKYGEIVHLKVLGKTIIVLGTQKAARDLLEKRSANTSDRPDSVMVNLIGFNDWLFVLMNYGSQWRRHRRAFHQIMNPDVIHQYQSLQTKVARNFLTSIRNTPGKLGLHIEFSFAATVMRILYGIEVTETNDKYFRMVTRITDVGEDIATPGRYLVEALPFLRYLPSWLPGAGFKKYAAVAKRDTWAVVEELFNTARTAMDRGLAQDSSVMRLLDDINPDDPNAAEAYDMCKGIMATSYVAGSDTTNATMRAFFLAMALHPEIQRKAQAQVDAVVGRGRLPEFSDRSSLPYINAIIKEVLRWHMVNPIALPHQTTADDEYNGYFIPAGAMLISNVWALSRDPVIYPDPENFVPERFLNSSGRFDCQGRDPADYLFGFGRRICPGRDFADASIFILCASILWAFNITPPVDERGEPKELNRTVSRNGVISHVEACEYTIESRSSDVDPLILDIPLTSCSSTLSYLISQIDPGEPADDAIRWYLYLHLKVHSMPISTRTSAMSCLDLPPTPGLFKELTGRPAPMNLADINIPASCFWLLASTTSCLLLWRLANGRRTPNPPLPPGPRPLPLLGNILDFPTSSFGRRFHEMAMTYGEVFHLKLFEQSFIVLDSYSAANDLLEKRSANYSDRPRSVMTELTGYADWVFVTMPYGQQWREHRRAIHRSFRADVVAQYQPVQQKEAYGLLSHLLDTPAEFSSHIKRAFASSVMQTVYGLDLSEDKDNCFQMGETITRIGSEMVTPGEFLVDIFPPLRHLPSWFPGGEFKKKAATWRAQAYRYRNRLFSLGLNAMRGGAGTDEESLMNKIMREFKLDDQNMWTADVEEMCKGVTATAYAGATDTPQTNTVVYAFFLMMAMFPDVQKKAQAELDAVLGTDRLPTFADRASLPYVNALIKEVLRWQATSPIGVGHRSVVDDVYKGYLIPAGSTMIYNVWAMSRDEAEYPDPERFQPERFLRPNPAIKDPQAFVFGFGRRICPGLDFADAALFIIFACVLYAFDISAPIDDDGLPVALQMRVELKALTARPEPFQCSIQPRSPQIADLVRANSVSL